MSQTKPIAVLAKTVNYADVTQFSKNDIAYALSDPALRPFYQHAPALDAFGATITERKKYNVDRQLLVDTLRQQYTAFPVQQAVNDNIEKLLSENTFTIATAHQPCLFTGPLYVPYKILSTIKLTQQLNEKHPESHFVPVFVIGGEDHDFDEINNTNLYGKKIVWENNEAGAVGAMNTASLVTALAELQTLLGDSDEAKKLYERVAAAYTNHTFFHTATQALLHEFFGRFGVIVINMNQLELKRAFLPAMIKEATERPSEAIVQQTQQAIQQAGFKTQAFARPINLFYMLPQMRERIINANGQYSVVNTDYTWNETEFLAELQAHPEHFSPNVIMRPLYQEIILPNIAYVGGGGEIAYWLERKAQFAHFGIPYPILVRRDSAMWIDAKQQKTLEKLNFPIEQLFKRADLVVNTYIAQQAGDDIRTDEESKLIAAAFDLLAKKALKIDPTLEKTMLAEKTKQLQVIEQLGNRLSKAAKQRQEIAVKQLEGLLSKLCPNGGLQERNDNFLPYILRYGDAWLDALLANFDPLRAELLILSEA